MNKGKCKVLHKPAVDTALEEEKNSQRKQIGLFGGSFNPVHFSHLAIADQVYHQLGLDKVLLMPSAIPPHVDEKKTIDGKHRLDMLRLAIAGNEILGIETSEIERGGKSYTIDTVTRLKKENPDTDYFFIIGGDMVEYLPKWHRIEELSSLIQFVGIQRPGYTPESDYPIIWVDVPGMAISSSLIRNKVRSGCSVRYFLPDLVLEYIDEKRLYLDEV